MTESAQLARGLESIGTGLSQTHRYLGANAFPFAPQPFSIADWNQPVNVAGDLAAPEEAIARR